MRTVKYIGCTKEQLTYNPGADDPSKVLTNGEVYVQTGEEVHSWHTLVKLRGYNERFPSVCFVEV